MALAQQLQHAFARLRADAAGVETEFRTILEGAPNLIEALFGLEMAKFLQGKPHAAGKTLARLVDDGARAYAPALAEAGVLLTRQKQFDLALKVLRKAYERGLLGGDGLIALAECEMAMGFLETAEALARQALAVSSENVDALFRLARILDLNQKNEEAISAYGRALERGEHAAQPYLARCLHAAGRNPEAEELCAKVLADDPHNAIALFVLAQCRNQGGRFAEAEKSLLALLRSPAFDETRTRMFRSTALDPREDRVELRRIVEAFWPLYGEILKGQGWFDQALAESRSPVRTTSEPHRPEVWDKASPANRPRLTLVSFASADFESQQRNLCKSALEAGNFDRAVLWTAKDLHATQFYREHSTLLGLRRGSGYWVWKPFILWNEMLCGSDGEYFVYCDSGRGEGLKFTGDARGLIAWCDANDRGVLPGVLLPKAGPNKSWTKRDCFQVMNCDGSEYWDHPQASATFSAWKNTAFARDFVKEWLTYALDPRAVTDFPNVCGGENHNGFIDHRHDQSILTNLVVRHRISLPPFNSKDINAFLAQMPK